MRLEQSDDRIPVEEGLSAPVQTGPEAYPAFYTMDTGSIPRVKWLLRGVNHPPPCRAEVKERTCTNPLGLHDLFLGEFYLFYVFESKCFFFNSTPVSISHLSLGPSNDIFFTSFTIAIFAPLSCPPRLTHVPSIS